MATKGGYQIVDVLELTYAIALQCLECGKPLLIVNDSTNTPYYADGVEIDGSENVIIHKGGRTITIETDGDVVASGEFVSKTSLYQHNIKITTTDGTPYNFFVQLLLTNDVAFTKDNVLDGILSYLGTGSKHIFGFGGVAVSTKTMCEIYKSGDAGKVYFDDNASIDRNLGKTEISTCTDDVIQIL